MTRLERQLKKLEACEDALEWAKGKAHNQAWKECERSDWMLWYLDKSGKTISEKTWRLMACDFAEETLPIWEKYYPEDKRPHEAIRISRLYADGKATEKELSAARDAARGAAWATTAAWSAVCAAAAAEDAAVDAARAAAWAARDAARDAAWSAWAASWAAWAAGDAAGAAARAAAWAARDAARAAEDAAVDAAWVDARDAEDAARKRQCDIIRKYIPKI